MRSAGGTTGVLYDALNFVKLSLKHLKLLMVWSLLVSYNGL